MTSSSVHFKSRTLVLRNPRDWDHVRQVVQELGWSPSTSHEQAAKLDDDHWVIDETVTLFCGRDRASGELGCNVRGTVRNDVERRFDELEDRLSAWTLSELLHGTEQTQTASETAHALFRLGLGASLEFDEPTCALVVGALSYEHPMIRAAAIRTMAYLEWGEMLRPLIGRVAAEDVDDRVRREAHKVGSAFDRRERSADV